MNKKKKSYIVLKILIVIIVPIMTFFIGVLGTYTYIVNNPIVQIVKEDNTGAVKTISITEDGISSSVSKVYDSVVVISTYKNDSLYATGSGFVYKIDNNKMYIITNNHVIESGNKFELTFTDGSKSEAKLLNGDEFSDIAVLETSIKKGISAVEISTSSITPGDTAFVIGAPLGSEYSFTVTRGIISGKERLLEVSLSNTMSADYVMNVIQTDAAVNSGNSGGPIANSNGEVIGVISAKIVSSGVEGMGFAIPIETATKIADQIIKGDKVLHPYLGITMSNTTNRYQYRNSNSTTKGVVIAGVEKSGPAAKGGLQEGDIITKINGVEVENIAYLRYELFKNNVGDEITITYKRDSKELTTKVKLTSNSNL